MKVATAKLAVLSFLAGMVAIHALVFWEARNLVRRGFPDFAIYYCAGTVARQGLSHQFYDPGVRFEVEQQFAAAVPQFRGPLPYTHPPFEAWLFAPFTYFSYISAYILWNLVNLGLLTACAILLWPHLPGLHLYPKFAWVLAFFAFFPVFFNLLEGQDAILLLFLYTLAYVFLRKNRLAVAGACLGLAVFKFHLVVPFILLLLLKKKGKVLYGFLPVAGALALGSLAMVGIRAITAYPEYVLYWEKVMSGSDRVPAGMPNLRGLAYIFLPEGAYVAPLLVVVSLGLLWFAAKTMVTGGSVRLFDLSFSLAAVVTVLVSFHVVSYDLSILVLPVLLLTNHLLQNPSRRWAATLVAIGIALLYLSPLQLFLSIRYKQFALMAIPLLFWLAAIAVELSSRRTMDMRQQISA